MNFKQSENTHSKQWIGVQYTSRSIQMFSTFHEIPTNFPNTMKEDKSITTYDIGCINDANDFVLNENSSLQCLDSASSIKVSHSFYINNEF